MEQGVITLCNKISSQCNSRYGRLLKDCDIEDVIRREPTTLPGEVQLMIRTMTDKFLIEFIHFLRERSIDVETAKCVFIGGGSMLLRNVIERSGHVAFPIFIDDVLANAKGYEILYQSEKGSDE